jgi:predicted MFS family arabinose efflux permease
MAARRRTPHLLHRRKIMGRVAAVHMEKTGPSTAMVVLLAAACGIVVANIYYAQPLIGEIAPAVGLPAGAASLIVTLTQLGYVVGLILLVPLGDLLENRRLVCVTIACSIPALLLAGLAHSGAQILAAAALIGLTSVAVQMLVPLAAHLAPAHRRGAVVGNVMSGLLLGILLSRPVASAIADISSWRTVFFVSAAAMLAIMLALAQQLAPRQPAARHGYAALLRSGLVLPFTVKLLRQRALYQAAAFGAFTLFWTASPLLLLQQFHFTQGGLAVFALVGAAGALAAPIAGRLADAGHGERGTILALAGTAAAFAVALLGGRLHSVVVLAAAGVLLDASVQCNLIFGQRAIYQLAPEMRARLNGMFMAIFFAGGAAASAVTSPLFQSAGWPGLCALGMLLPLLALGYVMFASRRA